MPAVLREHQHELSTADGNSGFVFGTEDTGYITLSRPVATGGEQTNGDRTRAQEDGDMFGIDFRGGKSVVFEIGVITDVLAKAAVPAVTPHRLNLDYLDGLEVLWLHKKWRSSPDALAMLRSREAGQTWRCYGRPRRYEEVVGQITALGYSKVVADFKVIDSSWYADDESVMELTLPAGPEGGLVAPLVAPLTSVQATAGANTMIVGGSKETWPVVEFLGPVTLPRVVIGSMTIGFDIVIDAGDRVIFDPRPWVRGAYRLHDNANRAGYLSGETPSMRDCYLYPGTYPVSFQGVDASGAARCTVRWRNARARP